MNRLISEKSPYLLQHAHNPVDWFPWGEEAFAKARAEQKPIFLSVGYSTCHWCHVMERESFEDREIAAIMNAHFVCIKVDREERPDIDKVYMTALQAMGQQGGWPMSMFLTPELKPFYGGTYYPPKARLGRGGFPDILERVHEAWESERGKVAESAENITRFLHGMPSGNGSPGPVGPEAADKCFEQFAKTYDATFGGFGSGPKFPRPVVFSFLLQYYVRSGKDLAREMCEHTLSRMSQGGIYDHIGGGFHRYSVDAEWRVPHFEKMLYDQAQLASSYVEMYRLTANPGFATTAREVLDYILNDLALPEGGFASAEDADSPNPEHSGEESEGAFYLWTKAEVLEALGPDAGIIFCYYYGIEEGGNAPFDPQLEFVGKNILYVAQSLENTAKTFGRSEEDITRILASSKKILADIRGRRPRPALDDKVIAGWNGWAIRALARGFEVLEDNRYLVAASRAAEFILVRLRDQHTGKLFRRYRDGEARFDAQLEDYAFVVQGLIDLYEASHETRWLVDAVELTRQQIALFEDKEGGGFFDTAGDDPTVLVRLKEQYDGAEPSGNAIAAMNLLRLAEMTDNDDWRVRAGRTVAQFRTSLSEQPVVMPRMVAALEIMLGPRKQIVIAGRKNDPATNALFREVYKRFLPGKVVLFVDDNEEREMLSSLLPFAGSLSMINEKPAAYVCEDYACKLPTTDPAELARLLDES